jgi:predicted O-methyltransferase YrrM
MEYPQAAKSIRSDLINLLFDGADPYGTAITPVSPTEILPAGWGSTHPYFKKYIESVKPTLIVEVGTWLGGSAIHMGQLLRTFGLGNSCILCVDTWLGSADHYLVAEHRQALKLINGRPTLYDEFIRNVCAAGLQNIILPFSIASIAAAEVLRELKIEPDLVYLDGDHTPKGFRADLELYWERLRPGGCMIGDDFDWEQVHMNVLEFAYLKQIELISLSNKFVMFKAEA